MAYVPVPKDLTKVKTKVMFNLTKRAVGLLHWAERLLAYCSFLLRENLPETVAWPRYVYDAGYDAILYDGNV